MSQEIVAEKAEWIAENKLLREAYKSFYKKKGFFLTMNDKINGATKKPSYFPNSSKTFLASWKKFLISQKKYLMYLADMDENAIIYESSFDKIRNAYNKWDSKYFYVFYGSDSKWACNLFVGEALYLAGYNLVRSGKYYSAKDIWDGAGRFEIIDKSNLQRGDIAAFGGSHVEIVTKVNRNYIFSDDDFCSRGAGRGDGSVGTEKCDGFFSGREIDDDSIRFVRVKK